MTFQPVTLLRVLLADGNRPVGRLASRDGRIWFEYATSFLTSDLQLSPFGLPLRAGVFEGPRTPFEGLHGVFDDSLPDGWGRLLLEREMDRLGVGRARLRPLDRLAWIGRTGMGALAFEPELEGPRPPAIIDLAQLAANAREVLEGDADALVPELLATGGSPGGARPKALVWLRTDDTAIHGREDPAAEAWLVKFRSREDPPDAGAVEFAYLQLARRAGLEVPQARLFGRGSGEPGFLGVRRFDRRPGGRRVHVHTFCGLLHADHRFPSATYEDLLAATRALTRDERQVRAQFRRMVFNVLAHNRGAQHVHRGRGTGSRRGGDATLCRQDRAGRARRRGGDRECPRGAPRLGRAGRRTRHHTPYPSAGPALDGPPIVRQYAVGTR